MKNVWKKIYASLIAISLIITNIPMSVFATQDTVTSYTSSKKEDVPENRVYITSTKYNLVPGATETVLTTNNEPGTDQRIGFIMEVDAEAMKSGTIKPVATYKDYQYDTFGLQTVTDQAKAYESCHDGETVIAGINADFFDMVTGEPNNAFVMGGTVYHQVTAPYFAILKDGSAVVRSKSDKDLTDVQEAVGGNMQIVTNGNVTVEEGDYQTLKYSRTAIGVKEDGSIITYVTHGISTPTSCGETYTDVAEIMIAQGCYNAVMLDGGGSATYASVREGTNKLTVQNNPSDGTPRTVSTCLMFASTVAATGQFDHASLSPNNEYYTPTTNNAVTTVQFEAKGVDSSGALAELPDSGLTWALDADSKSMGEIDANTGLFTAKKDAIGTVNVVLQLSGETVGTTSIQLVEPDDIYFDSSAVSLDFNASTNLGLNVKGEGVNLNIKDGDFTWTIESTLDDVDDDLIGSMKGNTFIAGAKQEFALEGIATVSYKKADGTKLSAEIILEIGKMPIVKMDFEDVESNERGKDVVGLWDWGTTTSFFSDAAENQVYQFQNYDTLYYLQSTTYSSDSTWINEVYETEQPWTENEDGTITVTFNGKEYEATKEETYGKHAEKWVSFTDENGVGYYWRGYINEDTWSGNYNAGAGSASAMLGADGYDMYVWHTSANKTSLASGELHGEGSKIVDAAEGKVRFGDYALKLTYDFRNFSPTGGTKNCNTYYRMTKPLVADGSPTGLGMWVYAPEEMDNFWLWTQITYWNGSEWKDINVHFKPSGADKTLQYTGINWTGWTYVEANLSAVYEAGAVVDADHPLQVRSGNPLILLTYIPGGTSDGEGHAIVCGSKTKGEFYIDNVRFVYGTNVDDMDDPQIISAKANETALSLDEVVSIATNDISFSIDFTDPQGENYSGIDETATQIYLDGSLLNTDDYVASADRAQTDVLSLANGEHTLKISICDNFGNRAEQTYNFIVNNPGTSIPTVSIEREKEAELGGKYTVTIKADDLKNIASVSTNITYTDTANFETETKTLDNTLFYDDYGNLLTKKEDGNYYDSNGNLIEEPMRPNATGDYYISSAVQMLGENLTGTVRNKTTSATTRAFTTIATVNDSLTNDKTLLTFTMPIPSGLSEGVKFPYSVTVTYTTKDGNTYTVTTGDIKTDIFAYYSIVPGIQVAGAENGGKLTINTYDGENKVSENVNIYSGNEEITGTFENNVFTTKYFTDKEAETEYKEVYIVDSENNHYSYKTSVTVAATVQGNSQYNLTLNATTGDSKSSENITWFAATNSKEKAIVQYMTQAQYDDALLQNNGNLDKVFENANEVVGTSELTYFNIDKIAAYVNNVKINNLSEGVTYVYRAGDGEAWSEVAQFETMNDDGSTDFMVMADTQLTGYEDQDAVAINYIKSIADATSNVDFGLQTGDFLEGGSHYGQWNQILGIWQENFVGKDFVHVIGNHEVYAGGSDISSTVFGLDDSEQDYYSVEYGEVYIAVINQTADLEEAAKWLVNDAAETDCTWKVLSCHQPIYYTNPNGSSEGHNKILKVACDEAGIDFTFSGHDHSFARTEQMKGGTPVDYTLDETTNSYVDKNGNPVNTQGEGTVYYICGDLGEKSRESGYAIVDNEDFHFAKTSQDYDALYLTVNATEKNMTVITWNMKEDGEAEVFDTFTMYSGTGICEINGEHLISMNEAKYNPETEKLICERCEEEVNPSNISYTGFATSVNGEDEYGDSQYYFLAGTLKTGFFTVGEEILYANEDGLIDHTTKNEYTNTCTENGKLKAYSPRYNQEYTSTGTVKFTGHDYETKDDGSLVCKTCGHTAIDVADWDFSLAFTTATYDGKSKTPAVTIKNPETGETLEFATDGMGKLTDFRRVWANNKDVGTATVTITINPNGDYTNSKGDVVLTLKIVPPTPANLESKDSTSTTTTLSWTGVEQATGYKVYQYKNEKWSLIGTTKDTTYKVENLNSSTDYSFVVKSYTEVDGQVYTSNKYSDPITVTTSSGESIDNWNIKLSFTKTTYNGNNKRPAATVTDANGNTKIKGTDYKIEYLDNQNAGIATVIVTGLGKYSGTKTTTFTIAPQNIAGAVIEVKDAVYNGNATETSVIVTDKNGKVMKEGIDFSVEFFDNTEVGIASARITAKGNYIGTLTANYNVVAADISSLKATIDSKSNLVYNGEAIEPKVNVDGLIEGVDFITSYENNIDAGTATAILSGVGNYTGKLTIDYKITAKEMKDFVITDGSTYSYTGEAIEADLNVISDTGLVLVQDEDYAIVEYRNNVEVGTATVVIEGKGNYTGAMEHQYVIQTADIKAFTIVVNPDEYVFTGGYKKPKISVENAKGKKLVETEDYTVVYENNRNAGTATVTVTGIGNYKGTAQRNFTINPADIENTTVTLSYQSTTFSGAYKKPSVTVKTAKGTVLKNGTNYTVSYENNKNAGTAQAIITGIGNYGGTKTVDFTIKPKSIKTCNISLEQVVFGATESEIKPTVKVVTSAGTTLKNGVNYTVTYKNNINVGTATAVITGIENYKESVELDFEIIKSVDLSNFDVKLSYTKANYSGTAKKPSVTITDDNGEKLVKGTDYTVTYINNVNVGYATVIIEGIGEYTGEISKTFTICPPKPTNVKVEKVTTSTIKVTFDRSDKADKYYIYVNGKYKGAALTTNYYTIKGLNANTTYSIVVTAVKVVNNKNIYSISNTTIKGTTK